MGWTDKGSNNGGDEIFCTCPELLWGPPSLLHSGYRVIPGGEVAWVWPWTPTPSCVEIKERVEIYLYSPSGPSWPVLGWYLYIVDNNTQYFVAQQKYKGNTLLPVHNNTEQLQLGKQCKGIVLLRFRGNSGYTDAPQRRFVRASPIFVDYAAVHRF